MAYVITKFEKDAGGVLVTYSNDSTSKVEFVPIPKDANGNYDAQALTQLISDIEDEVLSRVPSNPEDIEALMPVEESQPECSDCARKRRNMLLNLSDWTQIADAPLSQEQLTEASTYRQALRDVPNQSGFPENIVWPTLSFGDTALANKILTADMQGCGE
jgi:hypothetical protein